MDCCACKVSYSGRAFVSISDWFRDPLYLGEKIREYGRRSEFLSQFPDVELRGGQVYQIDGTISDPVSGESKGCR